MVLSLNSTYINRFLTENFLLGTTLLFVLITSLSFGQVSGSVDTSEIKIGEEIQYSINVEADTSAVVNFPEGQTFLPLEVIEFYDIDTTYEQAKYRLIKKYGLTQFDSGSYVIPRQRVRINEREFYTDSLLVEVADVVVDTLAQKMFDIKPVIDVRPARSQWIKYSLWILVALLIIAAIVYLLRRKKKKEEAKKQLPPYEEALVALQTLDTSEYLRENKIKNYYSALTEIVKRYLDREVDEAALESTTDELIEKLILHKDAGHLDFDKATIERLNEILKRADLIKFAKMNMESGQAQMDRKDIESIINETHEAIPEPSEDEMLQDEIYREQQQKKYRKKKIVKWIAIGAAVGVLIVTVSLAIFGWSSIKETLMGNPTKELLEGQWVRSEYGVPAVILETPEVLERVEVDLNDPQLAGIHAMDHFVYGSKDEKFTIAVSTTLYNQQEVPDPEVALERMLQTLEGQGGFNIIIDQAPFSTDKGMSGLRARGNFNYRDAKDRVLQDKVSYEIILFTQTGALQQIMIIYDENDPNALRILNRIIDSVELETPTQ